MGQVIRRLLACALVLACAALPAWPQTGGPDAAERAARARVLPWRDNVVRVLVIPAGGEVRVQGWGLIVGRDGEDLYIATPFHVVHDHDHAPTDRIEVEFRTPFGARAPAEIKPSRAVSLPGYFDLAVLVVHGAGAHIPAPAPVGALDLNGGNWAWTIGRQDAWDLPGAHGGFVAQQDEPERLIFDNLPTPPGTSGQAVATVDGLVGMVTNDGGAAETDALSVDRIIERFRRGGLPVNLLGAPPATQVLHAPEPPPVTTAVPVPSPALAPGTVFRDCTPECPEMVVIPSGAFTMGSPDGKNGKIAEEGRGGDEGPQHEVRIASFAALLEMHGVGPATWPHDKTRSGSFAAGRFDVTRGQFAAFVQATGYDTGSGCYAWTGKWDFVANGSWRDPGYKQTDDNPVVCVSWQVAQAYVKWLSERTRRSYRLPTEAEWEYAARAGMTTAFWTGAMIRPDQAQYDWQFSYAGSPTRGSYEARTSPVGSFAPNAFGLYDMAGNVWQWVQDCYLDSYRDAPGDGSSVEGGECATRVLRGGSWFDVPKKLRSACRERNTPDGRNIYIGFRVARAL